VKIEFNRPEAKQRAKAAMRGAYPHPMLVSLVFILATTVLINIIMYFVSNPFTMAYAYLMEGYYEPWDIFRAVFTPQRTGLYVLLEIMLSLYSCVMNFGYYSYGLRLARWEQPSYHNLLDGFALVWRVILQSILIALFTSLWGLLALAPAYVLLVIGALTLQLWLIPLGICLLVVGIVVEIAVSYRYRLAAYFMLDNPGMGALQSITRSKQAMRGWKWDLFVMNLSFLGWLILAPFTLGILSLWLTPYMAASEANFYDWVVYGSFAAAPPPPGQGANGGSFF
jgi:uncharacterized membrane protein